ncbi:hypothetical protein CVV43_03725 [Candidatus Saccharibacteria bacterium HGW-Saccharibacteria-1]|jgi:uncharacterized protein (UPF0335 family)|nr:MAG: hypothetical protein CVV43_03725 [Candidatus Saccharibacteria bacterium HGW-Saccharibacteria-1]
MSIYEKSPREIVAQTKEAGAYFDDLFMPEEEANRLKQNWKQIYEELDSFSHDQIDSEGFNKTLRELGEKVLKLGVIDPNYGEGSDIRQKYATENRKSWGIYTDEQANTRGRSDLRKNGANYSLKQLIKNQESVFSDAISNGFDQETLEIAIGNNEYEKLLEKTIDISTITETERLRLSVDFPSGNFLYHGANTATIVEIIKSGAILSGQTLNKQGEARRRNSGHEGVSLSMNGIDALPGDRRHIAGFVAAPEAILGQNEQLAIPSRPAPNEVIQISSEIDANKYYQAKTQYELYRSANASESNSVYSNLVAIKINKDSVGSNFNIKPMLYAAKDGLLSDPNYPDKLREHYELDKNGTIKLKPELLQQKNNEIPVAAVWLQAAIDQNKFDGTEFNHKNVNEIIDMFDGDNIIDVLKIAKTDWSSSEQILEKYDNINADITLPIEKMYLVAARKDLKSWLKIIATSEHKPAGILLYDHTKVRLENFASDHRGDNDKLTAELQSAITPSDGYIDYSNVLGKEFNENMRAGHKNQVISEKHLDNRRVVKKIDDKLVIV